MNRDKIESREIDAKAEAARSAELVKALAASRQDDGGKAGKAAKQA